MPRSRKWLVTINNPIEHGFDHSRIKASVLDFPSLVYWCLCDEQGDECETLHTHVYFVTENQLSHTQVDARFPSFHRDIARGKSSENRAYVLKDGEKFNKQPDGSYSYKDTGGHLHEGINFSDTFEEGGELPDERQGKSRDADKIVDLIKAGASNEDIVDAVASAYRDLEKVERVRSMYRDAQFKDSWRDLEVIYIFGKTGGGKTRSVMDKFGYTNCYRVTDYKHPFDTYDGQDVIIFEEFRSGLKHGDMLNYLDGYPLLLPCRYFNRQACFTKVFIITNIPPEQQYIPPILPGLVAYKTLFLCQRFEFPVVVLPASAYLLYSVLPAVKVHHFMYERVKHFLDFHVQHFRRNIHFVLLRVLVPPYLGGGAMAVCPRFALYCDNWHW